MLELKNIKKFYGTGVERVEALKGIDLKFRESEFVSILGQSGCGKTTLLNIIGGLDRYSSGDLVINGKSTKKFKDRDWDAYRNYKVGFIFQSYNLIGHQTILANVELALTLGGISGKERKERAIKALEEVGLKEHINKRPNQLSGGQMQRVAIARALVNNPDIILADEPTGALDTKTSIQVMEILKKISKDKLIIMVTHNPELAEKYSSRIIKILDGKITDDSNPIKDDEAIVENKNANIGKTSMKIWTAFHLSLNNLLTKKARTILVAFAGSIGIIGIALVQSVSNGFQSYVDNIQEETLTSYPLTIMQESTDITGVLLSMSSTNGSNDNSEVVKEEQYVSKTLGNISTNDMRSFKAYIESHNDELKSDISTIKYSYSVDPIIYTRNDNGGLSKVNPSNLFSTSFSSALLSTYTSTFSQLADDIETVEESYELLKGKWPEKYNELVLFISSPNSIADMLVYSLGLRDMDELRDMVNKIMAGEKVDVSNEPYTLTYDEILNITFKLIMPSDLYVYNDAYDIYEDMSEDEDFINKLYDNATELKIVGIATGKQSSASTLSQGIYYTSDLIKYIIDYSTNTEIVQKQLDNQEVDVISGARFDIEKNKLDLDFKDFVSVDTNMMKSAFNINVDEEILQLQTVNYMNEIANSITVDTTAAKTDYISKLNVLSKDMYEDLQNTVIAISDIEDIVAKFMKKDNSVAVLNELQKAYVVPVDVFSNAYSGMLKGLLQAYIQAYNTISSVLTIDENNLKAMVVKEIYDQVLTNYLNNEIIQTSIVTMSNAMTEAVIKTQVLTKVGQLTENITSSFASAFNIDTSKIADAFKINVSEDEITRIVTAMMTKNESNATTNLITLGYQDLNEPSKISFYFRSFDGKERFLDFIENYNNSVEESKQINYTDSTGILMSSVKTIVNAVTYVLIAFVSISLVVSSIMIGIITYISVYERTKEIGILRAMGASKLNISSIFNAETFIIGALSGGIGIGVTYILIPIINTILHHFTGDIPLSAVFYPSNAIILVLLSIVLTLIGGIIPAKAASKRDPVVALRTE